MLTLAGIAEQRFRTPKTTLICAFSMKGFPMHFRQLFAAAALALLSFPAAATTYPPGTVTSGGLTWTKPETTPLSYADAKAYCANTPIAGLTGWRLPTGGDFNFLWADRGKVYEQNWTLDWIWTMTPFRYGHYVIRMFNGAGSWGDMNSASVNYVTCVRGDSDFPATFVSGGLTWMRPDLTARTYGYAESYCTNTAIAGQTGWRLPTVDELSAMHTTNGSELLASAGWTLDHIWTSTQYDSASNRIVRDKAELSWANRSTESHFMTCVYPGTLPAVQYYPRDGSQSLTGPLAGGGQDANNLKNINATGTLTVPAIDTATLNAANIKPTQTVADNSACDPATQGYFAKNSSGVLLSCQAGVWTKLDKPSAQLQSQVDALVTADSAIQTQLGSLTATAATQTQLAALQVQLTTLQTQLAALNTATTTQEQLTAFQSHLNNLQTQVNSLATNDPSQMYRRDGTVALTGPLAGGGQDANDLRNISASGTVQADTASVNKLSAINITPSLTVLANSTCDTATQGYFAKDSNGLLLSCQFGMWTKQSSSGGIRLAAIIGLDPNVWPDYIYCGEYAGARPYFRLMKLDSGWVRYIHNHEGTEAPYHIQFNASTGAYGSYSGYAPYLGSCNGASITHLRSVGQAFP